MTQALPDLKDLDVDALKALVTQQHRLVVEKHTELIAYKNEIDSLKLLILKLRRMQFGPSSERLALQIDQLELRLEDFETSSASRPVSPDLQPFIRPLKP